MRVELSLGPKVGGLNIKAPLSAIYKNVQQKLAATYVATSQVMPPFNITVSLLNMQWLVKSRL
jgi:hypothetical protein